MEHIMVLGSGVIGLELFKELKNANKQVILASKSKRDLNDYIQVDALNQEDLIQKTASITHLFLTIGIPYSKKLWREQWPSIIDNVITAARQHNFKVIFFDNIYLYGALQNPITEDHPVQPISHKGETRKIMYERLQKAMDDVDILIARAPDFFGPGATNSALKIGFLDNMLKGKQPTLIGAIDKPHSYAYTNDLARAMIVLAEDPKAYHQVWHLPSYQTDSIEDIVGILNQYLHTSLTPKSMSSFLHRFLALFVPILKELYEMRYQFDQDYRLDFAKFSNQYPSFQLKGLEQALQETITYYQNNE